MSRRFFFWAPDLDVAVGGIFVAYEFSRVLRDAGYACFVLHNSSGFRYPFAEKDDVVCFGFDARQAELCIDTWKWRLVKSVQLWFARLLSSSKGEVRLGAGDVFVAPETQLRLLDHLPDGVEAAVVTQNQFTHARILGRVKGDAAQARIANAPTLATSVACQETAERLGARNCRLAPLHIDGDLFRYQGEKRTRIAYMPRKNASDAKTVIDLLKTRGKLGDFELTPIDGATREAVADMLGDALIFLAFSEREGFGLPPAEAMARGCIVIGFPAHGGEEFFDAETGFPVREGDLMSFVETVEAVVADYRADPRPLDQMRRTASETILSRYSFDAMRAALLDAWAGFFGAPEGEVRPAAA